MKASTIAKSDPEIRREKVTVTPDMSLKEIMEKHGISKTCAWNAQKRCWFVKNYSRNQIIIDRDHFNPELCYSIAKQVFWKRLRNNPVAMSIRDDLLQEAVYIQFIQSGKIKAGANEKYNERYGFWWAAYNGMMEAILSICFQLRSSSGRAVRFKDRRYRLGKADYSCSAGHYQR
ncbi:MAG: hypothetical protein ABIB93_00470 [Chloroflexota bacterium]